MAKRTGIIHKSVFALGINDNDERVKGYPLRQWANTPGNLEAQMRWIKENAPEMPGIAFFSSAASREMLKTADALAGEIFR